MIEPFTEKPREKRAYKPIKIIKRHTAEAGFQRIEKQLGTKLPRPKEQSIPREIAEHIALDIISWVRHADATVRASIAGSIRRQQENAHDIDILVSPASDSVREKIATLGEVLWNGPDKISIIAEVGDLLGTKIQVDIRFVRTESWGPALQYFTGSKEHNISLRRIAKSNGLSLNENGLWDSQGHRVDDGTEGSIYKSMGLRWLPPKYRNGYIKGKYVPVPVEPKSRCPVCDRPIRNSDVQRHIDQCHKGFSA